LSRKQFLDVKIFQGLLENYLSLNKCKEDLRETQKLLGMMRQDDMAQKFQFTQHTFFLPKYCFLSVLYTRDFLSQIRSFPVGFNDKVKSRDPCSLDI
jgi:hypothetical protein